MSSIEVEGAAMGTPSTREVTATGAPADPRRWLTPAVVLVAAFMDLLGVTIVNVAVPNVQRDLEAGYSAVGRVTAGYTPAFAAVLISGGRLGDIYGRRRPAPDRHRRLHRRLPALRREHTAPSDSADGVGTRTPRT